MTKLQSLSQQVRTFLGVHPLKTQCLSFTLHLSEFFSQEQRKIIKHCADNGNVTPFLKKSPVFLLLLLLGWKTACATKLCPIWLVFKLLWDSCFYS